MKNNVFTSDFETLTYLENGRTRVWAWGCIDIYDDESFVYGTDISEWFGFVYKRRSSSIFYFHNLKFDGDFIVDWLLNNGWEYTENSKLKPKQFTTLISDMGVWYSIKLRNSRVNIELRDSLKIYNMGVEEIAKSFGFKEQKLEIDYNAKREKDHKLTDKEIIYLKHDVVIIAKAIRFMLDKGYEKLTAASNALNFYKELIGGHEEFRKIFPKLLCDRFIRKAYKGGFTYVSPNIKGKEVGEGIVLDANSMYPWAMKFNKFPYGEPEYFTGKYEEDAEYDLYFQSFSCSFYLKKDKIPTVQDKSSKFRWLPTEYIRDSDGIIMDFVMTNIDMKLFFEHYEVDDLTFTGGYKFKSKYGLFNEYIDYWYEQKRIAKSEGNKGMYLLSKLMLNSLYGKFASKIEGYSKIPYIGNDGVLHLKLGSLEEREPVYIPVGCFVTAYARDKIIRSAQKCYNRFMYADTDSLHLLGKEIPEGLEIDEYKLGAWKIEGEFKKAKYLRAKTYVEAEYNDYENKPFLKVTCAGLPDKARRNVTFENFNYGSKYEGKLIPKRYPGGIILTPQTFEIKY